jgi:hypothetical protein
MGEAATTDIDEFVGISLNGVLLSSGLKSSHALIDPVYPAKFNGITKLSDGLEDFDECLVSIEDSNSLGIHHYHLASPCLIDTSKQAQNSIISCADSVTCANNYKIYATTAWASI